VAVRKVRSTAISRHSAARVHVGHRASFASLQILRWPVRCSPIGMPRFPLPYEVEIDSNVLVAGNRPPIPFGPPPEFGGDAHAWSPEHLFVSAIAACYEATFHALARKQGLAIGHYVARANGSLEKTGFTKVELRVTLDVPVGKGADAQTLLEDAKKHCFVANSLKCPVTLTAQIRER